MRNMRCMQQWRALRPRSSEKSVRSIRRFRQHRLYSGFVYSMLDLPLELYTPIFAISRIAGWSAHRIEELINAGKIIRPAYKSVKPRVDYVPLHDRK